MGGPQAQDDFFISYTSSDRTWAEWIAWQLKEAGASVVLQAWDMVPGLDFVHEMHKATTTAKRTLAVLSPAYFTSQFGEAEWRVAFANDPSGKQRRLIPVRVVDFTPPGLLATRIYIDLVGKDRQSARTALLEGVKSQPAAVPSEEPTFPGEEPTALEAFEPHREEPRLPSALPPVWSVPYLRNRAFTGREHLLEKLAAGLGGGTTAAITQAIAGLGGVGKTSLAVEYAYRQRAQLDVAWWVRAEEPATLLADFTGLASALELPEAAQPDPPLVVRGVHRWLADHDRWLLVFDNANRPEELASLLPPAGGGQVLVTSRWTAWDEWATPLRLPVLSRKEAVAFVSKHTGAQDDQAAAALAEALGDLPLALAEAAAYINETQISLDEYLELVQRRATELFGLAQPAGAQRRVATVWSLSLERVREEAPGAEALLALCAFLAPDAIPRHLPAEHTEVLPEELTGVVGDRLGYNEAVRVLGRYSLLTATPKTLGLHRLVQAVIRARLQDEAKWRWAQAAIDLLSKAFPRDSWEVATWPACEQLLPHVLAATEHADQLGLASHQAGRLLDRTARYLHGRGQYQEAKPVAQRALAVTQRALGGDHSEVGERHDALGRVLRELAAYANAKKQLERALAIHEAACGPDDAEAATRHGELGRVLRDLGDLAGAKEHTERALAISEATVGPDHPDVATRRNQLGRVLRELGDLQAAEEQLRLALRSRESRLGPDHRDVGAVRRTLGLILWDRGDLPGAKAQLERALAVSETALDDSDHPALANWHSDLGNVLRNLGDLAGAKAQHERALAISEARLGPDHPHVARSLSDLGLVLRDLDERPAAQEAFGRARTLLEARLASDHPDVARTMSDLGLVLRRLGELPTALTVFRDTLAITEDRLGPDHPHVASILDNLGAVLRGLGKLPAAKDHFERALVIREARLGHDHPRVARTLDNLGLVLREQGDLRAARICLERAKGIFEARLGSDHPHVARTLDNLGLILRKQGDLHAARTLHERAVHIREARLGADHPDTVRSRDLVATVAELENRSA